MEMIINKQLDVEQELIFPKFVICTEEECKSDLGREAKKNYRLITWLNALEIA